jgi:hypothetical protein
MILASHKNLMNIIDKSLLANTQQAPNKNISLKKIIIK